MPARILPPPKLESTPKPDEDEESCCVSSLCSVIPASMLPLSCVAEDSSGPPSSWTTSPDKSPPPTAASARSWPIFTPIFFFFITPPAGICTCTSIGVIDGRTETLDVEEEESDAKLPRPETTGVGRISAGVEPEEVAALFKKEKPPAVTDAAAVLDIVGPEDVVDRKENDVASATGGTAAVGSGATEDAAPGLPRKENPVTAGAFAGVAAGVESDKPLKIEKSKDKGMRRRG